VVIHSSAELSQAKQTPSKGGIIPKARPAPDISAPDLSKPIFTTPQFSEKAIGFFKDWWPYMFVGGIAVLAIVVVAYSIKKDEKQIQKKAK
jgi:hypothetical protein